MKIGFVSMPFVGHLNPMTTLARRLQSRGHEVAFIGVPDVEPFARAAGLNFVPFCEDEYSAGSIARLYAPVSKLHGFEVTRWSIRERNVDLFNAASKHLPQKLAETGIDALVIDVIHTFLELVPISLGMPYVQVSTGLHIDFSGATPVAMSYAEKLGLQVDWSDFSATASKLAVITQTPKEFDFPGILWPAEFHYAGPFYDIDGRDPISFPWEKLNGNPLVYASMGTLVNGLERVYKTILQAVGQLTDIQVVLSVGKNLKLDDLGTIPSNVIVVRKAPQIELLKRAALCITHAGLNTALESLAQGVPMVAIPIAYDQPGVATRVAYHGVGEFLEIEDLAVERVQWLIQQVLENPRYREKARWFRKVTAQTRGLDVAADVIERAFRLPVYPQSFRPNPSELTADTNVPRVVGVGSR